MRAQTALACAAWLPVHCSDHPLLPDCRSLSSASPQIYVRPTLEAVELKTMDTTQVSWWAGRVGNDPGLRLSQLPWSTYLAGWRQTLRLCCSAPDHFTSALLSAVQPLTSRRNMLTRFAISTVYVVVLTTIGCAVREARGGWAGQQFGMRLAGWMRAACRHDQIQVQFGRIRKLPPPPLLCRCPSLETSLHW